MASLESLQDEYSPNSVCFGCGPKNPQGLHLKSRPVDGRLVAEWTPGPFHMAFSNFASGGVISVVLDCHGNWTAAYTLMKSRGLGKPPGTVTAEYIVRFLRPTPMLTPWKLEAWPTEVRGESVRVEGKVEADGKETATMKGLYIAVKEDHPAFHKWE